MTPCARSFARSPRRYMHAGGLRKLGVSYLPTWRLLASYVPTFLHVHARRRAAEAGRLLPSYLASPSFLRAYFPTCTCTQAGCGILLPSYLSTFVPSCPMRLISSYLPTFLPSYLPALCDSYPPAFLPSYLPTFAPSCPMRFISSACFKASVIRVETPSFRSPPACMYM